MVEGWERESWMDGLELRRSDILGLGEIADKLCMGLVSCAKFSAVG